MLSFIRMFLSILASDPLHELIEIKNMQSANFMASLRSQRQVYLSG